MRAEVEAAERLGISHGRLMGREYGTRHEYDAAGRMVRSVTESEWTTHEIGLMLALGEYRDALCPCGCGNDVAESTNPDSKWDVPPPARCQARTALTIAQKPYETSPQPESLLFRARRIDD